MNVWIITGILVAGGLGVLVPWLRRRRVATALSHREALDDDSIYARYYAKSKLPKVLVIQLWHEVAETLRVPVTRLRPDDRFGKEVGSYMVTSEDLDVLAVKGRDRAKALGISVDLQTLGTVDDYIRCFAKAELGSSRSAQT